MALATLERAKQQLSVTMNDDDALIESMLEDASEIVLDYIARPSDAEWTATLASWTDATVPGPVRIAVLLQLADLYRFRGDDDGKDRDRSSEREGFLSPDVTAKLHRYRLPVVA